MAVYFSSWEAFAKESEGNYAIVIGLGMLKMLFSAVEFIGKNNGDYDAYPEILIQTTRLVARTLYTNTMHLGIFADGVDKELLVTGADQTKWKEGSSNSGEKCVRSRVLPC